MRSVAVKAIRCHHWHWQSTITLRLFGCYEKWPLTHF